MLAGVGQGVADYAAVDQEVKLFGLILQNQIDE